MMQQSVVPELGSTPHVLAIYINNQLVASLRAILTSGAFCRLTTMRVPTPVP